ncbi:MAG: tRNA preQ1(34) S-adenosylmethionine ribosyltransferase-isomerase QueA [Planctomycetota bacterium]
MSQLDAYDYTLPRELIAQHPLPNRVDARLMVVDRATQTIDHYHVRDLPELLRAEDVLVRNDSRVIPARLIGRREQTGGRWQGLFLRVDEETGVWELLSKTRGRLVEGELIVVEDRDGRDGLLMAVVGRLGGNLLVRPLETPDGHPDPQATDVGTLLQRYGRVPIPPYIRDGHMVDSDLERYQTVYASEQPEDCRSVAAPTAGLHFTDGLLKQIAKGQTSLASVTLHVGVGTFRPIGVDKLEEHEMHAEWGRLDEENATVIADRRSGGGRCVAIGTTSVRVLESAASHHHGDIQPWTGMTDLFIRPPYSFAAVDCLMTNFHLPKSSLIVLVSAFAGHELTMRAYQEAVESEYRFYSYGDAMLIV